MYKNYPTWDGLLTIDKENDEVIYNDAKHLYVGKDNKEQYVSVTTLIHYYQNEFDKDFWSSYKALEALLDPDNFAILRDTLLSTKKFDMRYVSKMQIDEKEFFDKKQEVLDGYAEANKKGCERGTEIHAQYENQYYGKEKHNLKKFGLKGDFICKPNYYELNLPKGIYPEFLISKSSEDGILKVAGQIDLLVKDGNDIYIYDYKTNKELKRKSYYDRSKKSNTMMKHPLSHIMDCNFMHYTLQLSTYAYLLQQINPDFNIKLLQIIYIDHNNNVEEIEVDYLKDDVIKMLKHYKRYIKMKSELDRDKPIQF